MTGARWTPENVRHALSVLRHGRNPASTVYDSIGSDFFLALAPGWLNLGLWDGDGSDPSEAPVSVRRLVEAIAAELPAGGDVLDVGNGLAEQDPVIAAVASPRSLTALNITLSQLVSGRRRLAEAGGNGVNADATRMPFVSRSFDGVISVEAAFHFPSRARFFCEVRRVLRPGGVLTMSDVPVVRMPRTPAEAVAGFTQLRVWGLGAHAVMTTDEIVSAAEAAGLVDVRARSVGERVIGPALRFVGDRLALEGDGVPASYRLPVEVMVRQVQLLWDRRLIDYVLLRASSPETPSVPISRRNAGSGS